MTNQLAQQSTTPTTLHSEESVEHHEVLPFLSDSSDDCSEYRQEPEKKRKKRKNKKKQEEKECDSDAIVLAIVGSRNFMDWTQFIEIYTQWRRTTNLVPDVIVSGGASGTDTMAKRLAELRGIAFEVFEADWVKYGKRAGPIRNTQIVNRCTHLLALPAKDSRGTQDSIRKAKRANRPLVVEYIDLK